MKNPRVEELKKKIEELETTLFYLDMIDMWTSEQRTKYEVLSKEIKELKMLVVKEIVEQ